MTYDAIDESDEWDSEDWDDESDSNDTIACPACQAEIYDDAVSCPACGEYIIPDQSPWAGSSRKGLMVVVVLAVIVALLWPTIRGLMRMLGD